MEWFEEPLKRIEEEWDRVAPGLIAAQLKAHPTKQFYAAAFWLFYCDYTMLGCPCLAMDSEENFASAEPKYDRWTPPNWKFDVVDTPDALSDMYDLFEGEHDDDVWEEIMEGHKQAIARVCLSVTAKARRGVDEFEGLPMHPRFVVGIFEEREGGEEYVRLAELSVAPEIIGELDLPLG